MNTRDMKDREKIIKKVYEVFRKIVCFIVHVIYKISGVLKGGKKKEKSIRH